MYLKHALWRYLNDLELQKKWKQFILSMRCDSNKNLELEKNENKYGKLCIVMVFETIWNAEKKWKLGGLLVYYDTACIWNGIRNCNEKNSTCFDLIKAGVR